MGNFNLGVFLLAVLPVLLAITVHEAAHGYAARHYGDRTAEQLGRLTLNPLAHIDPIGTIVVPAVMFFTTGFMFGWAKPVPVVTRNLRDDCGAGFQFCHDVRLGGVDGVGAAGAAKFSVSDAADGLFRRDD